jgi:hypothetical protein
VTATAAGHHFVEEGGRCRLGPTFVAVNIGTAVIGTDKAAQRVRAHHFYFAAAVGKLPGDHGVRQHAAARTDGTYPLRLLTVVSEAERYVAKRGRVTLDVDRHQGRFHAALRGGGRLVGAWTC